MQQVVDAPDHKHITGSVENLISQTHVFPPAVSPENTAEHDVPLYLWALCEPLLYIDPLLIRPK